MRKRVALPNGAWWEQGANRRRGYGTVYSRSGRVIATSMKLDELNALVAVLTSRRLPAAPAGSSTEKPSKPDSVVPMPPHIRFD